MPIGMPLLGLADVDLRLSAGEIRLGSARIGKSAAALIARNGRLAVNISEAQFYGGVLSTDIELEADNDAVSGSARIAVDETPAAVALTDLAGLSLVEGTTSARIEVSGQGGTLGEFTDSLSGTADFKISDGALLGVELAQLATLSGGFDVVDPASGSGTLPLDSLTGKLSLASGRIAGSDILAEGETFSINLDGQISLIDRLVRAKGVLNAEPADTDERSDIPFVVSGSWLTPLLLPDYESLIRRGADAPRAVPLDDPAVASPQTNG